MLFSIDSNPHFCKTLDIEDLVAKFGWKKTSALFIAISLIVFIFVGFSFASVDNAATENLQERMEGKEDVAPTSANKTFITPYYQISYPPTFNVEVNESPANVLSSIQLRSTSDDVSIMVATYESEKKSVEDLSKPLDALGYRPEELTVNEKRVQFYTGSVTTHKLTEIVAIVEHSDYTLRFNVLTKTQFNNAKLKEQLIEILKSIR